MKHLPLTNESEFLVNKLKLNNKFVTNCLFLKSPIKFNYCKPIRKECVCVYHTHVP